MRYIRNNGKPDVEPKKIRLENENKQRFIAALKYEMQKLVKE